MWMGEVQRMVFDDGTPKGLKQVLEERGIRTQSLVKEQMQTILAQHHDFKNEKTRIEHFLDSHGHTAIFLPKFHPELNPIERVWAQSKRYSRAYCKYTLPSLQNTIPPALNSVELENIQNYHRKVRHYMCAYLQGMVAGFELEQLIKKYKKAVKAHRKISINE